MISYFNLPQKLDVLLRSASIVRPKTTWYNLPNQLEAVKLQLLLANEDLEDDDLALVLASIPKVTWFNIIFFRKKNRNSNKFNKLKNYDNRRNKQINMVRFNK